MSRHPAYFDFAWGVPESGFRWLTAAPPADESSLVPVEPVTSTREYQPMREHPGLFMQFADLELTKETFQRFANQYGALGPSSAWPKPLGIRPLRASGKLGMSMADWELEVTTIRNLRRRFSLPEDGAIRFLSGMPTGEDVDYEPGAAISRELANQLARIAANLAPTFVGNDIQVMPTTLLGAMWLQVSLAFAHAKEYRRCAADDCPRVWFEVSKAPFGLRKEAKFCSATCRNRDWARRASR